MYINAINDFRKARRKASIQGVLSRITRETTELLSYEEVRQKLRALEGSRTVLRTIPIDAIVGSVGRYTDFTRDFLPLSDEDEGRWARVMAEATGLTGLPPIDVYQIGEVFFVLDGNHRVSVARQLGANSIQAYVREVHTRVNITADTQPDDLIIKAEQINFLEQTQLDRLRPNTDFTVTNPGQYPVLLEHIEVHRYFMGIDEKRDVSYQEAVLHWHDEILCQIIQIIRERGTLRHFPQRTETDLYLWISRHRAELEETLDWRVDTADVVTNLELRFSSEFPQRFQRLLSRVYDAVTPDALETGPAPGTWREAALKDQQAESLLSNILVLKSASDDDWPALDQALILARKEAGQIQGLHIAKTKKATQTEQSLTLASEFDDRCKSAGINGRLAIESGEIARIVCERSLWTDLIVTKVTYPPGVHPTARFSSGLRTMISRCPRPILLVRDQVSDLDHALLAYNGTPKANEALYLAVCLGAKWGIQLSVLIIEHKEIDADAVFDHAHQYLASHQIDANFIRRETGKRSAIILQTAQANHCDFILMGGYKSRPIVEVFFGSLVDEVIRQTRIPLLICR